MAGNLYNNKDSMDINELASLNNDITDDFIDELQAKLTKNLSGNNDTFGQNSEVDEKDDSALFEEPPIAEETLPAQTKNEEKIPETANTETEPPAQTESPVKSGQTSALPAEGTEVKPAEQQPAPTNTGKKEDLKLNEKFDDNFIKKYKAKLNKKVNEQKDVVEEDPVKRSSGKSLRVDSETPIEKLSQGNISEKQLSQELKEYNDSLDFLDGNVKYSKYVIYIEPENVDFIEGLSVKERKNLINKILRQQDDIESAKYKFKKFQVFFVHILIAVLAFSISIPLIYTVVNASLEATINNYRRSQSNWQTLYKQNGKIPTKY